MDAITNNIQAKVTLAYFDSVTNNTEIQDSDSFLLAIPDKNDKGYYTSMNKVDDIEITGCISSLIEGALEIMSYEGRLILGRTLHFYLNEMFNDNQNVKEIN